MEGIQYEVGFHYVLGCIQRPVGFEGIWNITPIFSLPFNPTYGTGQFCLLVKKFAFWIDVFYNVSLSYNFV